MAALLTSIPFDLRPADVTWADDVALRLRLILATAADEKRSDRAMHLESEIQRSLETVAPAERTRHIQRLAEKFPTGPAPEQIAPLVKYEGTPSLPQVSSPQEAVQILIDSWPDCSAREQANLREKLVAAGIVEVAPAPVEPSAVRAAPVKPAPVARTPDPAASVGKGGEDFEAVRQKLMLAPADELSTQRLAELSANLIEFLLKLDQLVWNTWRALAPRSPLKRDTALGDIKLQLRRHLKGDETPSGEQISQQIEKARQMIAILLGSISQVGRGFVNRHQMRYAPEAIRDLAKAEGGGGMLVGLETKCWRKYTDLAVEINETTIQNEMQEVVAKYVEDLMRGKKRGNN
jgi:hypothetical protein